METPDLADFLLLETPRPGVLRPEGKVTSQELFPDGTVPPSGLASGRGAPFPTPERLRKPRASAARAKRKPAGAVPAPAGDAGRAGSSRKRRDSAFVSPASAAEPAARSPPSRRPKVLALHPGGRSARRGGGGAHIDHAHEALKVPGGAGRT